MTNESLTIASADLHLVTREDCVYAAQSALRDYKATMLCVIEFWCKPKSEGGLGLPIEELADEVNKKPGTLKDYRTELYKLGRLEKERAKGGRPTGYRPEVSEKPDTTVQPTPTPTPTTTNDLPHHPAPTPQQQCVQADGWTDATVVTAEVVTMPDGELDYQRAIQLFDEIISLSKRNFASGWTELQWNELGGYCRTFEGCCNARGRRNGSVAKKPVPSAPAFEPCLN
jgi:hypothetical protein